MFVNPGAIFLSKAKIIRQKIIFNNTDSVEIHMYLW